MVNRKYSGLLFPTAADDRRRARIEEATTSSAQINSGAYRLAFDDIDFILRDEMRPVRFLLELTKPELILQEYEINQTIVIFGSARNRDAETARETHASICEAVEEAPDDRNLKARLARAETGLRHAAYYEQARELAGMISKRSGCDDCPKLHVVTGGGPGIMEAANRGAEESGAKSVGLNIVLPHEQYPNPHITPELCFQFHYFALRKMHFMLRARALAVFPGGYGTMDELFEVLTLIQTQKVKPLPVLLFGREYWENVINFDLLVAEGMINEQDVDIFTYVEDVEIAWELIKQSLNEVTTD